MLTESENLKYQLESLASYEPSDIDNPEFEVGYEAEDGTEGFATVCCINVAKQALDRINNLETALQAYARYVNKEAMERDIKLLSQK